MEVVASDQQSLDTRDRLVHAAVELILRQGYTATSVGDICTRAGVTKGGFFHYFENKEAIGVAAAQAWFDSMASFLQEAVQKAGPDPLKQMHAFFDALEAFTKKPGRVCACVVGMLSQEMALVHPGFQSVAARYFTAWTDLLKQLLLAARQKYPSVADFDPEEVAWFVNALWQGSIVVVKAVQKPELFQNNLRRARGMIDHFFKP